MSMFFDRNEPWKVTGGAGVLDSHTNSSEGHSDSSSDFVSDNEIRKKIERKFGRVIPDDHSKASVSNSGGIKPVFKALGDWTKRFSKMADVGGFSKLSGGNPSGAILQEARRAHQFFPITQNSTIHVIKPCEPFTSCPWRVDQEILRRHPYQTRRGQIPQILHRSDPSSIPYKNHH